MAKSSKIKEIIMSGLIYLCAAGAVILLWGIIGYVPVSYHNLTLPSGVECV